jgi:hypothetical protein
MLWLDQPAVLGGAKSDVQLRVASRGLPRAPVRHVVAKHPVAVTARGPTPQQKQSPGSPAATVTPIKHGDEGDSTHNEGSKAEEEHHSAHLTP